MGTNRRFPVNRIQVASNPEHNLADVPFLYKRGLRVAYFFQPERTGNDGSNDSLLDAVNQALKHLRRKNGAAEQAQILQIKGSDIQADQRAGNGPGYGIPPAGMQDLQVLRPPFACHQIDHHIDRIGAHGLDQIRLP